MMIVIMIISTMMTISWILLLGRATEEDWVSAAYAKVFDNLSAIDKLREKDKKKNKKRTGYKGIVSLYARLITLGDSRKKIEKLEHDTVLLQKGTLKSLNILPIPGYVLQREVTVIGKSGFHKTLMSKCFELYGKKHAQHKSKQLLARMLSYPLIGIAVTLALGVILTGTGSSSAGMAVIGIGSILIAVMVYAIYDELSDMVRKRQSSISKQFPNVVSKLALLVTSGMIMDRAWKETAYSRESELYREMRKTSEELDNLVSPELAYSNFINRCNTKESAKLASAIMQNLSKGNAEIGKLLKDMAREAWQERRHTAKRDAEKANSKLMIPTMLLFIAILIMLMVPVALNFSGI